MNPGIESIEFRGQPALVLSTKRGARAVVSLLGGQLLSWVPAGGEEWLYLSERAQFETGKAIRGGSPVCFPQFSTLGELPRHGFARTRPWRLATQRSGDAYALISLVLEDDAETRALWPHAFRAELTIAIEAARVDLELDVQNAGAAPLSFTAALHTYLRVREVEDAELQGLGSHTYRDMTADGVRREDAHHLRVDHEIDRIYPGVAQQTLMLQEARRGLAIQHENFPDVVVWNPWEEKCAAMADMAPLDFRRMLCVEAAAVAKPLTLAPGAAWWGRQTLVDLDASNRF
jgi:glucose-6-phosphate 1-epimerase